MIIEKICCGFQTGADIGGALAARRSGVECFGWMPKGFRTEAGPRPHYAVEYGARETQSEDYPPRTKLNVYESDALLWFGDPDSNGGRLTIRLARDINLPIKIAHSFIPRFAVTAADIAAWIAGLPDDKTVLMIAGNRESVSPGIGAWVEAQMTEVFSLMMKGVNK